MHPERHHLAPRSASSFHPQVHYDPAGSKVDLDPIQLLDSGDTVLWNFSDLDLKLPKIYLRPLDIQVVFKSGPVTPVPALGPFTAIGYDRKALTAQGSGNNGVRGPYLYDILVNARVGSGTQYLPLSFPIDPQIDNMAPPPHLHKPPHDPHEARDRDAHHKP